MLLGSRILRTCAAVQIGRAARFRQHLRFAVKPWHNDCVPGFIRAERNRRGSVCAVGNRHRRRLPRE